MSSTAPSVPLLPNPNTDTNGGPKPNKSPIWPLTNTGADDRERLLPANCARAERPDGICCRDLKDDERTLVDPDVVRDIVIGLSDGLTVPFALTAGLSSLGESKFVVLAGVAELIAGAISMGIGGFLASQAERDHARYVREQTRVRVGRSCEGEVEREVEEVLGVVGVEEGVCREVARCLREVEEKVGVGGVDGGRDEETVGMRWSSGVGLTAFLLKFGHRMEEVPTKRLYISAFTIGTGYLVGGLIPLLPYFFIARAHVALIYSVIVTGIVLLVFGAVKAHVTGAGRGTYSYVWGSLSTLLVGGVAAGAAFGIVRAMESKS